MYYRAQLTTRLTLLVAIFVGCGRDSLSGINAPESLILYSIDGRDFPPGKEPITEEKFHRYPVLGKVEIKDPDKRKAIITALKKGISESGDGAMADCFWPRHAIKLTENGKTIDYVICFECSRIYIYSGGSIERKPTTSKPQSVFNKHLQDANVPLTPGMVETDE